MSALAARFDGGDRATLALALAAHVALFALLSLTWGREPPRAWPSPVPLEVSLVTEVAPTASAPPAPKPPAPSVAPDEGQPEAPPPAPAPAPQPRPRPEPVRPAVAKPAPAAAAKPVAAPKPAAKPAPPSVKPQPADKPQPVTRPVSARPAAAPAPKVSHLTGLQQELAAAAKADTPATRPRGRRLGDNFLAGLAADAPAQKASAAAPAARAGPYPTASIVQAIARQIQPCADRQVNPGPGANAIVTTLNIRLNEDGTLAATPRMVRQAGVDGDNERYAQRVVDLGVAAFKGCTPLKLPAEYYQTGNGGWSTINYQWKLR